MDLQFGANHRDPLDTDSTVQVVVAMLVRSPAVEVFQLSDVGNDVSCNNWCLRRSRGPHRCTRAGGGGQRYGQGRRQDGWLLQQEGRQVLRYTLKDIIPYSRLLPPRKAVATGNLDGARRFKPFLFIYYDQSPLPTFFCNAI